jgi:3-oxoacyl-[acyl-carrier-protein] synthase I
MSRPQIAITAIGMVSAVGLNAVQTCAAIRAGIAGFREWEQFCTFQEDGTPEALVCARAPVSGNEIDRVVHFSLLAMKEAVQNAGLTRAQLAESALFFSWPQAHAADPGHWPALLARAGVERLPAPTILAGHAGALQAMQSAAGLLMRGTKNHCIIVGADSFLAPAALKRLDAAERLKSARNMDALIPGEGAAALVLEADEHARRRKAAALANYEAVGTGVEANAISSGDPSTGMGLCQAIAGTLAGNQDGQALQWVVCDLNGESYRAREWGNCLVRLHDRLGGIRWTWHPADCIGDVGAASAAMLTAMTARAFERGYAPAARALLWASSEDGQRAAVVLSGAEPDR